MDTSKLVKEIMEALSELGSAERREKIRFYAHRIMVHRGPVVQVPPQCC